MRQIICNHTSASTPNNAFAEVHQVSNASFDFSGSTDARRILPK
jgi:hypothetical protein